MRECVEDEEDIYCFVFCYCVCISIVHFDVDAFFLFFFCFLHFFLLSWNKRLISMLVLITHTDTSHNAGFIGGKLVEVRSKFLDSELA
jgi:hypothetical protein